MEPLDLFLTERDKLVYRAAGYGRAQTLGVRPAVLVIDATYEFTGLTREPILEAAEKVHTACGEEAWAAVDKAVPLVAAARAGGVPILYTKMARDGKRSPYAGKNRRSAEDGAYDPRLYDIVDEVAPQEGDVVIGKLAPSAFQGTDLLFHLIRLGVDTLLFLGGTTSGCVRASVTEAFAYGFRVCVVGDCVFDRFQASHAMSLFDMNAKFANVLSQEEALAYLRQCAP